MGRGNRKSRLLDHKNVFVTIHQPHASTEHCDCGTGCADCFGKINCGCPDCYTPPEPLKVWLHFGEKNFEKIEDVHRTEPLEPFPPVRRPIHSHHADELGTANILEKLICDDLVLKDINNNITITIQPDNLNNNRYSGIWDSMSYKVKRNSYIQEEKPKKEFKVRSVRPAKQTRYYCKKCCQDICNLCFSKSCSGHPVQFLGQSKFACESPYHEY